MEIPGALARFLNWFVRNTDNNVQESRGHNTDAWNAGRIITLCPA